MGENQKKLSLEDIEEILEEARNTKFARVSLKVGNSEIRVRFQPGFCESQEQGGVNFEKDTQEKAGENAHTEELLIKSPRVGRFYSTSVSTSLPTIRVGDRIKKSQKICMIEAMGVEHELVAPCECILQEVCVADGEPVMYNQPLFRVRPVEEGKNEKTSNS